MKNMKRIALIINVWMACHLVACSSVAQEPSMTADQSDQTFASSEESTMTSASASTFGETAYQEILTTYANALNEKWDGSSLIKSNIDTLLLDCYGDAPLENVGYAVIDLDDDGTEELVIGTTERLSDEFYGKLILALYTRNGEGTMSTVFQSMARDRYYYTGENQFANLGSSGADDSVNITVKYAGGTLTDTGLVTDPADYVQMELTPMSQWVQTIGLQEGEQTTSELQLPILDDIDQNTTVGTAGSFMSAVQSAVKLLDWGIHTGLDPEEVRAATVAWMADRGNDEQVAFAEKLSLVDEAYQKLLTSEAETLLSSAGIEDTERFWTDSPVEPIEAIMQAAGLR